MSIDTMFRTGNAIHGAVGIIAREGSSNAKPRIVFRIAHAGTIHAVTFGRFADNRIAEVIMPGEHSTAARLVTALLLHGEEIETVRNAVDDGGVMAAVLDRLMEINGGPRDAAYRWLLKVDRRQTMNRRRTSQMWKHWAEADEGEYVSNASFIAAATDLGFKVQWIPNTPNVWINIAEPRRGSSR